MSTFGIKIYDATGSPQWDSTTAMGGVIVDYRTYAPTDTDVLTYPDFAAFTPFLISILYFGTSVVLDTSLGYPRVTVSAFPAYRTFALAMY